MDKITKLPATAIAVENALLEVLAQCLEHGFRKTKSIKVNRKVTLVQSFVPDGADLINMEFCWDAGKHYVTASFSFSELQRFILSTLLKQLEEHSLIPITLPFKKEPNPCRWQ